LNVQLCCTDNVHKNVDTYIYSSCRLLVGGYMKETFIAEFAEEIFGADALE